MGDTYLCSSYDWFYTVNKTLLIIYMTYMTFKVVMNKAQYFNSRTFMIG